MDEGGRGRELMSVCERHFISSNKKYFRDGRDIVLIVRDVDCNVYNCDNNKIMK